MDPGAPEMLVLEAFRNRPSRKIVPLCKAVISSISIEDTPLNENWCPDVHTVARESGSRHYGHWLKTGSRWPGQAVLLEICLASTLLAAKRQLLLFSRKAENAVGLKIECLTEDYDVSWKGCENLICISLLTKVLLKAAGVGLLCGWIDGVCREQLPLTIIDFFC